MAPDLGKISTGQCPPRDGVALGSTASRKGSLVFLDLLVQFFFSPDTQSPILLLLLLERLSGRAGKIKRRVVRYVKIGKST